MSDEILDYLVIGAGPAGLQMGRHLKEAGRAYLIVEAGPGAGTSFTVFPRHRTLISSNKPHTGSDDPEFNLRMDWNSVLSDDPDLLFTRYTDEYFPPAREYVRYLEDFAKASELRIAYGTRITSVDRDGDFVATDEHGVTYRARRVVSATGVAQRPNVPPIEGIELAEQYATVSVDRRDFVNQRVLIIGAGNSAFETAENLIPTAAVIHVAARTGVKLAWKTHYVGHLRAVNNNFLDTYQLKSQNAILDGAVLKIERDGQGYRVAFSFVRADEIVKEIYYDRVICATGFRFDAEPYIGGAAPKMVIDDRFPEQTSEFESSSVPGLHFAGTITQQRDFKHGTSGFIHGFRYGVRALHRILERKYHGVEWPGTEHAGTPEAITAAILARVNRSSALWQQFDVIGDVVVADGDTARYYEELPVGFVHDQNFGQGKDTFVVTLEYGPDHDKVDPFDITVKRTRQNDAGAAFDAAYLHPVIRHWRGGEQLGEHHVAENLENEWDKPAAHVEPLVKFLAAQLT
ncbi:NAD(P)-binding domain-containing protein [Kutzneria sp. 744]|uniref:NAD(P)-binding domain-containing protein n=1 Tax=Kutzneria sp. (strain 744) TaxID=345341 RepID=UPI0003EEB1A0|nr:NAD(P)-binding domain-containing protein [Kutzneria sp. 744]EWM12290.1 pyridine nucleotide-disulfide oxidoreductase [Kutzneria sp. 744]